MRKETTITLNDNGTSKKFKIRQFSARQQQNFIMRLGFCICESEGAKINFSGIDINGLATEGNLWEIGSYIFEEIKAKGFSIFSGLDSEKIQQLLDELTGCCKLVIDRFESDIDEYNIESYKTLTKLQIEAFKFNFFTEQPQEETSASHSQAVVGRQKA